MISRHCEMVEHIRTLESQDKIRTDTILVG